MEPAEKGYGVRYLRAMDKVYFFGIIYNLSYYTQREIAVIAVITLGGATMTLYSADGADGATHNCRCAAHSDVTFGGAADSAHITFLWGAATLTTRLFRNS